MCMHMYMERLCIARRYRAYQCSFQTRARVIPFPICLRSTIMATKIQTLQLAELAALEKLKKVVPKDVDVPPEGARCKHFQYVL